MNVRTASKEYVQSVAKSQAISVTEADILADPILRKGYRRFHTVYEPDPAGEYVNTDTNQRVSPVEKPGKGPDGKHEFACAIPTNYNGVRTKAGDAMLEAVMPAVREDQARAETLQGGIDRVAMKRDGATTFVEPHFAEQSAKAGWRHRIRVRWMERTVYHPDGSTTTYRRGA